MSDGTVELSDLESEIRPAAEPHQPIAKVNYSHKGIIDFILANPGVTQRSVAEHFGYTESWLSTMMSSDAFRVAMDERRIQVVDPELRKTIEKNFNAMVLRSQEILISKLARPPAEVSDNLALRAMELAGRAAGYGAKDQEAHLPHGAIAEHLETLAGGLTTLLRRKREEAAIDGEVVP